MKPFTAIRQLGKWGDKLRAPLALLYLLLSMAAAWHAPHDIPSKSERMIQSASASSSTAAVDKDGFCALCSWQALHQQTASATQPADISLPLTVLSAPSLIDAPLPGFSPAHLARGPPSV